MWAEKVNWRELADMINDEIKKAKAKKNEKDERHFR
jgi:hypothetical protein